MKVLVTGANGYIGRHVVKELLDNNIEVVAISRNISNIDNRAKRISFDINLVNDKTYSSLGFPDVCVDLAWQDGFVHNSHYHIEQINQHFNFMKELLKSGLKHYVGMGSMHEIGYFEGAIDENSACNPLSYYGIAKNALRLALGKLAEEYKITFQWIRSYYIYGDDKFSNSIFSKLIKANSEGKKTFPFTTGKNKYDFISVSELAKQISSVALQTKITGIINCCSGKPQSLSERVEGFIKENSLNIKLEYGVFPDRKYDSPEVWGDDRKIKNILMFGERINENNN